MFVRLVRIIAGKDHKNTLVLYPPNPVGQMKKLRVREEKK